MSAKVVPGHAEELPQVFVFEFKNVPALHDVHVIADIVHDKHVGLHCWHIFTTLA